MAFIAAALGGAAACSLIIGKDGVSDGRGSEPDAALDSPVESAPDVNTSDAPTLDASPDQSVPDAKPCAHLFCDDFDDPAALPRSWDLDFARTGTFDTTTVVSASAPRSLQAQVEAGASGRSYVSKKVVVANSAISVRFKMRLDLGNATTISELDPIWVERIQSDGGSRLFELELSQSSGAWVDVDGTGVANDVARFDGKFHDYLVTVAPTDGGPLAVRVFVDSTLVVQVGLVEKTASAYKVRIGMPFVGNVVTGKPSFYFDDFSVDSP